MKLLTSQAAVKELLVFIILKQIINEERQKREKKISTECIVSCISKAIGNNINKYERSWGVLVFSLNQISGVATQKSELLKSREQTGNCASFALFQRAEEESFEDEDTFKCIMEKRSKAKGKQQQL